jgi:hypothetical protein
VSSLIAAETSDWSFWIGRGGRTIQPKSRNWRFTSPLIVGTAYDRKSRPIVGSKPRAAFSSAM